MIETQSFNKRYTFKPVDYVMNGPENQWNFFNKLYELQRESVFALKDIDTYFQRLSLVEKIYEDNILTAQYLLEKPKKDSKHWNTNYGPHGWHRYVGRFPPHLVRSLLNYFGANSKNTVLDPFSGSGTTLVECRLLGINSIGVEVCPLSALMSRVKSQFPSQTTSIERMIDGLEIFYRTAWKDFTKNKAIEDFSHEDVINRAGNKIKSFPNIEKWFTVEALLGCSIVVEYALSLKGYNKEILCCALSSRMRSIGNIDVDVVRAEYRKTPREGVDVLKLVRNVLLKYVHDIKQTVASHISLMDEKIRTNVIESNILNAKFGNNSIDFIVTSPPYGVEAISYIRTHLLSYRCLEPILNYDPYKLNKEIIGNEYLDKDSFANNGHGLLSGQISKTFRSFFRESNVLSHKDNITRFKMMQCFFDDMAKYGELSAKWLRKNGKMAFVIGNKKLGNAIIPTEKIIEEIFGHYNLSLEQVINHKLKCNNSNSRVPWEERSIQDEFIMIFKKD